MTEICVLCAFASSVHVCDNNHPMCSRCHQAYWQRVDSVAADTPPLCPINTCRLTLRIPTPPQHQGRLTVVKKDTPLYNEMVHNFITTFGKTRPTIEKVYLCNNPTLSDMFELFRARMVSELRPTEDNLFCWGVRYQKSPIHANTPKK